MLNLSKYYNRDIYATFGLFIKQQRVVAGISRSQLAIVLKIDESFLTKVENDKKRMPVEKFEFLAVALNVSLDKIRMEYYSDILAEVIKGSKCPEKVLDITKAKLNRRG